MYSVCMTSKHLCTAPAYDSPIRRQAYLQDAPHTNIVSRRMYGGPREILAIALSITRSFYRSGHCSLACIICMFLRAYGYVWTGDRSILIAEILSVEKEMLQ